MAPELHTDRLILTLPMVADLDAFAAMLADPAVYGPIGAGPETREQAWHRILRYHGHWSAMGHGHWFAHHRASGRLAGSFGLMENRRASDPSFEGTPEVGWALAAWAHGQGLAAEALGALFGWADARIARTVCIIDLGNAPSLRLAARIGYRPWATGTYRDRPTLFLERQAIAAPVTA